MRKLNLNKVDKEADITFNEQKGMTNYSRQRNIYQAWISFIRRKPMVGQSVICR
ncbi:hypothetical protein [Prevotella corporis]|uniref:hypothetical protein n=1 Tax=Prevotella corporis TaxID=28128 RepID=UPI0023664DE6|nr:hypothetical protein [Prevotella corporis]